MVFKCGSAGYQVLHSFKGGTDGANPYAGVTLDPAGNLYGSTYQGGTANAGVVYKIDPSGQETVLYAFTGGDDGANPYAGVTLDSAGNLYGTTVNGGAASAGVVYRVTPAGLESVLLAFAGKGGGANPYGSVTFDAAGNLYGTTYKGGARGYGEIYKLSPSGAETLLYSFTRVQGGESQSGVILDAAGNLYGTVEYEVYKVDAAGTYTMLHRFDGEGP
ncbi:MAG: choice-of-anchor tandem repeat GloVer-containing protein [Bryobacteraceae bacterium]